MQDAQIIDQISDQDFLALGLSDMAYVKTVEVEDQTGYAVHAADGRKVAVLRSREAAELTIRQHELTPVSVH